MTIWELRFNDGRGASFYTAEDITSDIGTAGLTRTFEVAASVFEATALSDAHRCLSRGEVLTLTAHMGSLAYALRHKG